MDQVIVILKKVTYKLSPKLWFLHHPCDHMNLFSNQLPTSKVNREDSREGCKSRSRDISLNNYSNLLNKRAKMVVKLGVVT